MFHLTSSKSSRIFFTGSNNILLKSSAAPTTYAYLHSLHDYSTTPRILFLYTNSRKNSSLFASQKHFHPSYQKAFGYSYTFYSATPVLRPISGVDVDTLEKQFVDHKKTMLLSQKLQEIGIDVSSCMPGQYNGLICPRCEGWKSHEKSLSLRITEDGGAAVWTCFRAKCGWKGSTGDFVGVKSTNGTLSKSVKIKKPTRKIIEESLGLEPLCGELLAYFAGRMISAETLRRNGVMQKNCNAIAFTYRRNGELVSCKYRDIQFTKRFWQEANTEKIFYGLDDIKGASDVIIVEGEMDKFAMEEAGFKNCVSVPHGAPSKVSKKALPLEAEDTGYQYIWNSKDYTAKASRIVLATDGDAPGQALVEELARRLGRDRCWRVHWPMKDGVSSMKDANEVLMSLGVDAVRDLIIKAELYQNQMHNLEWRGAAFNQLT